MMDLTKSKAIGREDYLGTTSETQYLSIRNRLSTAITGLRKVRNYATTCADWISIFPKQGLASNYLNNVVTMIDQILASLEEETRPFSLKKEREEKLRKEFYDRQQRLL